MPSHAQAGRPPGSAAEAATPQRCGRRSRRSYSGRGSRARARVWGRGHDVQADDVIQVLAAERGWDRPVMEGEDGRHRFASSGSKTSRRALASGRSPSTVAAACALTWAMSRVVASASHRAARRAQTMPPPVGSGQVESGAAADRPSPRPRSRCVLREQERAPRPPGGARRRLRRARSRLVTVRACPVRCRSIDI